MSSQISIFISYARLDGSQLAHRLQHDIEELGPRVWLDTTRIDGGSSWSEEIELAIDECDVAIALLSHKSFDSRICRAEQLRLIRKGKPIIPLLVQSNAERPLHLEEINYLNFSDDTIYDRQLEQLFKSIKELSNPSNRSENRHNRINKEMLSQRQLEIIEVEKRRQRRRQQIVGEMPIDVTYHFQDRNAEQRQISQWLSRDDTRIVSIIGRGGMGKSALACKVLKDIENGEWAHLDANVSDKSIDGIAYLSTRTAGISLERLFWDCAHIVATQGSQSDLVSVWTNPHLTLDEKISKLLDALSDGNYIILLDNTEDLLDITGDFHSSEMKRFLYLFLTRPHTARLLITTRVAIVVPNKLTHLEKQISLLDGLSAPHGISMLRSLDPTGQYGLRDTPDKQLAVLVDRLHGIPRALEIAVGMLADDPFLSPEDILRNVYDQQNIIHELVNDIYTRLQGDTRRILEALAVFARPVSPVAVDFLLGQFDIQIDIPHVLRQLVRTHIVGADRASKRVSLHPIDCEFLYLHLPESGEYCRRKLEYRAAEYYAEIRTPSSSWQSIHDVQPQLYEFDHRIKAEDFESALGLLKSIDHDYMWKWGHSQTMLDLYLKLQGKFTDSEQEISLQTGIGFTQFNLGNTSESVMCFERGLEVFMTVINPNDSTKNRAATCWRGLGIACRNQLFFAQCIDALERSLVLVQETNSLEGIGAAYGLFGETYLLTGEYIKSYNYLIKSIDIANQVDDYVGKAYRLHYLGRVFGEIGQFDTAINLQHQAQILAKRINAVRIVAASMSQIAQINTLVGDHNNVVNNFVDAIRLADEVRHPGDQQYRRMQLAKHYLLNGYLSSAEQFILEAEKFHIFWNDHRVHLLHGIIRLLRSEHETARASFENAIREAENVLERCEDIFMVKYTLGLAFAGLALISLPVERIFYLQEAQKALTNAVRNSSAKGILLEAIKLLDRLGSLDQEKILSDLQRHLKSTPYDSYENIPEYQSQ